MSHTRYIGAPWDKPNPNVAFLPLWGLEKITKHGRALNIQRRFQAGLLGYVTKTAR